MPAKATLSNNRLLQALPADVVNKLQPKEERAPFAKTLFAAEDENNDVFFPHAGTVISLLRIAADGAEVEVGVVGAEGFAEIQSVLGARTHSTEGVIQAEGAVTRVPLTSLRDAFRSDGLTMDLLLRYTGVHLLQVTQNALCNALHSVEQRLSKWLLVMRDRVGTNEVNLTQEFLAQMLGIHRPGVTTAIGALTKAGLIEHSRNRIVFSSPDKLAARACTCYSEISGALRRFEELLAGSATKSPTSG